MPKYRRVLAPRRPAAMSLRESAAAATAAPLRETTTSATVAPGGDGRMFLQIISEGWGSSGYYAAPVLEQAARDRRFPKGLHLYLDHPSATEEQDRPERSVRDLAAVFTEDARYDPDRRALVGMAKPLAAYRGLLSDPDFVEAVGLSIRAGGLAEYGTAEGRDGLIVREIREAQSVDFVTRAGRGGKVLALLESARARLREAPTEQTRAALDKAVRDAYSSDDRYAWVRDWDPDRNVCWFDLGGADGGTWEQQYLTSGPDVALYGPRRQVTAVTVYRPVVDVPPADAALGEASDTPTTDVTDGAPPTGSPNTPEEEPDMSGTNTGGTPAAAGTAPVVDTAALQEAHVARDTALREAETQRARADRAEAELATFRAVESARPLVAAQLAEAGLPAAAQARITASVTRQVPLTESRQLDQNGLRSLVDAEVTAEKAYLAQLAEAQGAGQVTGFGQAPAAQAVAPSPWSTPAAEPNAKLIEAYQARGLNAEAARAAALGRAV